LTRPRSGTNGRPAKPVDLLNGIASDAVGERGLFPSLTRPRSGTNGRPAKPAKAVDLSNGIASDAVGERRFVEVSGATE